MVQEGITNLSLNNCLYCPSMTYPAIVSKAKIKVFEKIYIPETSFAIQKIKIIDIYLVSCVHWDWDSLNWNFFIFFCPLCVSLDIVCIKYVFFHNITYTHRYTKAKEIINHQDKHKSFWIGPMVCRYYIYNNNFIYNGLRAHIFSFICECEISSGIRQSRMIIFLSSLSQCTISVISVSFFFSM